MAPPLFLKQRLRQLLWGKGLQVIRFFAEADKFDRNAECLWMATAIPPFARAVELGHDEAAEWDVPLNSDTEKISTGSR